MHIYTDSVYFHQIQDEYTGGIEVKFIPDVINEFVFLHFFSLKSNGPCQNPSYIRTVYCAVCSVHSFNFNLLRWEEMGLQKIVWLWFKRQTMNARARRFMFQSLSLISVKCVYYYIYLYSLNRFVLAIFHTLHNMYSYSRTVTTHNQSARIKWRPITL